VKIKSREIFSEFTRFFPQGLNPLKIHRRFKFEFLQKFSLMQSLTIFGALEGICFVFQSSEEFEIHLEKIKPTGAHLSAAHLAAAGARTHSRPPFCRSPLVTALTVH
jgi:hypothetical protein